MINKSILIVEDDNRLRKSLALEFEERGYEVTEANSLESIPQRSYDYALVDLRLGASNGLKVIEHIKAFSLRTRIVVLTGYGSIATAVEAIKLGAINYLTKPTDMEKIESALRGESVETKESEQPITLSQQEHEYIEYMLAQNGGNITKTAKALGLHRQSLQRKLKKLPNA